jgi:hypothetical protein
MLLPHTCTKTGVTLIATTSMPGVASQDVRKGTELCWRGK